MYDVHIPADTKGTIDMIATVEHIDTTVLVRLNIEDGPTVTKTYGKRKFRVDAAVIKYTRRGTDRWKTSSVALSGPWVLKDGSDGQDRTTDSYWDVHSLAAAGFVALTEQHRPAL